VLIVRAGAIHTMDEAGTIVEAMVVQGREIVYLGDDAGTRVYEGPHATIVEHAGKAVLPGFHDTHAHLVMSATERLDVELSSVATVEALLRVVEGWARRNPQAPWVRGGGWSMASFEGLLHKSQLDAVVPHRPVFLGSTDGHTAFVNGRALELAGITRATPDLAHGRIERDEAGDPTGLLQESAMTLVARLIPPYLRAQVDEGLARALCTANAYGITTIVDAGVEDWMLAGYARAAAAGTLTLRVHGTVVVEPGEASPRARLEALRERYSSDRVTVGAAKLFVDGIIESRTGYMLEPYTDGTNGTPIFGDEELRRTAIALDAAGFQLHAHVIGDGATRQFLDALEAVVAANGRRDRRPLLAHLEVVDPEDFPRFAELGALADFQFLWAYPDEYVQALTWPVLGQERSEQLYPVGALHRAGATIVAGSDWSVSSMNPFEQIEVAVTRQDPAENGGLVLGPQHRIDLMTALRAFTSAGAQASFSEALVGTLEVGKRADFVVLDRDPFGISPYELSEVQVLETWLDGEQVFARADSRRGARVAGRQQGARRHLGPSSRHACQPRANERRG
jgi:predicted amidohydrolase YtcJ